MSLHITSEKIDSVGHCTVPYKLAMYGRLHCILLVFWPAGSIFFLQKNDVFFKYNRAITDLYSFTVFLYLFLIDNIYSWVLVSFNLLWQHLLTHHICLLILHLLIFKAIVDKTVLMYIFYWSLYLLLFISNLSYILTEVKLICSFIH